MTFRERLIQHSLKWETNGKQGDYLLLNDAIGQSLENEVFVQKDFAGVELGQAKLTSCIFFDTNFLSSNLSSMEIAGCIFINCNFSKAELYFPVFENVIFNQCRFFCTEFSDAKFQNCIFNNSDLTDVMLFKGKMTNCIFEQVKVGGYSFVDEIEKENVIWIPQQENPGLSAAQP